MVDEILLWVMTPMTRNDIGYFAELDQEASSSHD